MGGLAVCPFSCQTKQWVNYGCVRIGPRKGHVSACIHHSSVAAPRSMFIPDSVNKCGGRGLYADKRCLVATQILQSIYDELCQCVHGYGYV